MNNTVGYWWIVNLKPQVALRNEILGIVTIVDACKFQKKKPAHAAFVWVSEKTTRHVWWCLKTKRKRRLS